MTVIQKTCFVLTCDVCGDGWSGDDDYGTPHFDSSEEAIKFATRDGAEDGWVIPSEDRALCPGCAFKADCAATGHQWPDWEDRTSPNGVPYRHRWCEHCNDSDYDPPFAELKILDRLAGPDTTEVTR